MEIEIPSHLEYKFYEKFSKLKKKLVKLGSDIEILEKKIIQRYSISTFSFEFELSLDQEKYLINYTVFTLTEPEIVGKSNVEYIGSVSYSDGVKSIFSVSDEYKLFNQVERCDHCKINRNRVKYFYFLENDEIKSIGSTCVNDYFGHNVVKILSCYDREIKKLSEYSSYKDDSESLGGLIKVVDYMCQDGFWKKGEIHEILRDLNNRNDKCGEETKRAFKDYHETKKVCVPAVILQAENKYMNLVIKTNFDSNIKNALFDENNILRSFIPQKLVGVAAYVIFTLIHKRKEKSKPVPVAVSDYIGKPKDKITLNVKIANTFAIDGYYGTVNVFKFLDKNENIFTWFSSGSLNVNIDKLDHLIDSGDFFDIKGTIKEHRLYKDQKTTILLRVKIS